MENNVKEAFGTIQAPERLKRKTKACLRKKTFDYGRNVSCRRAYWRRLATTAMLLVLLLTGAATWLLPVSSIGLDVNPSLELQVNALDRVVGLRGRNEDGLALAEKLDVTGMLYDEALQRILISDEMDPYLANGSLITITVVGKPSDHTEQMLSKVVCRAYAIAEEENVLYCQADKQTRDAARRHNLSVPRYLAWQQLLRTDPEITAQEAALLPKEVIQELAQLKILENPCGE